jgi:dihydrofolate reductase
VQVSLIAAAAKNGVIGADGRLPWHLPDDFRWFKAQTLGKPVVMGRRTWESLGRPLPGRMNIVLTRRPDYRAEGAEIVATPDAAIVAAGDAPELMVIGGGEIYRAFLPRADRIYLTRVEAMVVGDAYFPELVPADWHEVSSRAHAADDRHAHAFTLRILERVTA